MLIVALILLVLVLLGLAVTIADLRFDRMVRDEQDRLRSMIVHPVADRGTDGLPASVVTWLERSGAADRPPIASVRMDQRLQMRLRPDQADWTEARSQQIVSVDPPAFHWTVRLRMMGVLPVRGRDRFQDGHGEMRISLLSMVPVVNAMDDPAIDEASLQRFLAEIVWYPTAARHPAIRWDAEGDHAARATLQVGDVTATGVFSFDATGGLASFSAQRFRGAGDDATRSLWTVTALDHATFQGVRVPSRVEATWTLNDGTDWTWLRMEVTDVVYDDLNTTP